jgi:hypothetical protein
MPWPNYILDPDATGGEDFTTMTTAEAAIQTDWGGNQGGSTNVTLACKTGIDSNATVTWDAYAPAPTASSTITIHADGHEHGGVRNVGYVLKGSGAGQRLVFLMSHFYVRGVAIDGSNYNSGGIAVNVDDSVFLIERVFLYRSGGGVNVGFQCNDTLNGIFRNCKAESVARAFGRNGTSNAQYYNCTAVNCSDYGYNGRGAANGLQRTIKNSVAYNCAPDWLDLVNIGDSTNNASGGVSVPGPNGVTDVTDASFVDYAGGDFTPAVGGNLDGAGADLSTDFTDDIAGNTRSVPWEIGAHEIVAAGGVTFDGPDIVAQSGTQDQVFTFDENGEGTVASRFSVT